MTLPSSPDKTRDRTEDDRGFDFAAAIYDAVLAHSPAGFTGAEKTQLADKLFGVACDFVRARNVSALGGTP